MFVAYWQGLAKPVLGIIIIFQSIKKCAPPCAECKPFQSTEFSVGSDLSAAKMELHVIIFAKVGRLKLRNRTLPCICKAHDIDTFPGSGSPASEVHANQWTVSAQSQLFIAS
jgi:hypothetical protein